MNHTRHVKHNLTDYVLGLVSDTEKRFIAQHIAGCPECQLALSEERQIGIVVRDALNQATHPDYLRLQTIRPSWPNERAHSFFGPNWQPKFALIGLLLILIFGFIGIQPQLGSRSSNETAPVQYVTLAAVTDTPTLTQSSTRPVLEPTDFAVPTPLAQSPLPHPAIIPVPVAPLIQ